MAVTAVRNTAFADLTVPALGHHALSTPDQVRGRHSPAHAGAVSVFAVQVLHLRHRIASAGRRPLGHHRLSIRAMSSAVSTTSSAPSDSAAGRAAAHRPPARCRCPAPPPRRSRVARRWRRSPRDGAQRLHQRQVALDVLALEARRARGSRRAPPPSPVSADEAARQHAIGRDADAELAAGRQDAVLDAARDQRILDLQIADRCTAAARRMVSAPTSDRPIWRT